MTFCDWYVIQFRRFFLRWFFYDRQEDKFEKKYQINRKGTEHNLADKLQWNTFFSYITKLNCRRWFILVFISLSFTWLCVMFNIVIDIVAYKVMRNYQKNIERVDLTLKHFNPSLIMFLISICAYFYILRTFYVESLDK